MNIKEHCFRRYSERFKGVEGKENITRDVIVNKELYEKELNKMFEHSKLLYTGIFKEHEEANYYIVDNIILIVDLANTKIITLYRIEFGFGRDIDKNILNGLIEDLDKADTEYIQAMDIVKERKEDMEYKILSLEEDIKSTEELLNTLKLSLNELHNIKQSITLEEDKCRIARHKIAKKLVYSNIYKNAVNEY